MDGEDLGLIDGTGSEEVELGEEEGLEGGGGEEGGGDEELSPGEHEGREEDGERSEEEEAGGRRRVDRADLPMQLRKALRANPEIAKQFPRLEKQLTGALFKANTVDQLGGVQKFREFADTLEAHGGPEGIASMASELEEWKALDHGFETGDPKVVDGWAKDYPEGFRHLLPVAIDKMESVDQPTFEKILSAPMWRILDRCGVISTMGALEHALQELDDKIGGPAKREFGLIKQFMGDLRALAVKAKSPDPLAADRQRLTEEREGVQTERERIFYGSVRQDVNGQVMARMNKLIRQELGANARIKLSVANRLRKEINAELNRTVNTAAGYAERYKAVMAAGDRERATRFIVAAANAKLPGVVKALVSEFNLRRPGKGNGSADRGDRQRAGGGSGGGGSKVVTGRPKTSEVDFTKIDQSRWLLMVQGGHGKNVPLKNGKVASW